MRFYKQAIIYNNHNKDNNNNSTKHTNTQKHSQAEHTKESVCTQKYSETSLIHTSGIHAVSTLSTKPLLEQLYNSPTVHYTTAF